MIEKERLEELIEQEETVWCISELWGSNKLKLHNKDVRDSDCFHISKTLLLSDSIELYDEEETYKVPFQLLFETEQEYLKHQEEAEWHKEFGCIERTERLELPTWEEFIKFGENSHYGFNEIKRFDNVRFGYCCRPDGSDGSLYIDQDGKTMFLTSMITKENYTLACRKAKELFLCLGEKE